MKANFSAIVGDATYEQIVSVNPGRCVFVDETDSSTKNIFRRFDYSKNSTVEVQIQDIAIRKKFVNVCTNIDDIMLSLVNKTVRFSESTD